MLADALAGVLNHDLGGTLADMLTAGRRADRIAGISHAVEMLSHMNVMSFLIQFQRCNFSLFFVIFTPRYIASKSNEY